jgi:hypothetical protein
MHSVGHAGCQNENPWLQGYRHSPVGGYRCKNGLCPEIYLCKSVGHRLAAYPSRRAIISEAKAFFHEFKSERSPAI